MKAYTTPISKTIKRSFSFGNLHKGTLIYGNVNDVIEVIGETKSYYITTNSVNNKIPKIFVD